MHNIDTVSETRDTVSETRDTVSETRDTVSETRDTVSETRDTVSETRDTVSETRDTVSETDNSTGKIICPNPSDVKLIIVVCQVDLKANLNLNLIACELKPDDRIVGLKMLGVNEWGRIKAKSAKSVSYKARAKAKTNKKTTVCRADFSNQCTIIVHLSEYNRDANLKFFGTGKVIVTGCYSPEEAYLAVKLAKERISHLTSSYQIKRRSEFSDHFKNVSDYHKFVLKNHLVILKLLEQFSLKVELNLDLVINKKKLEKYKAIDNYTGKITEKNLLQDYSLNTLIQERIIIQASDEDLNYYLNLIQIINICRHYFNKDASHDYFLNRLDNPKDIIYDIIKSLYQGKIIILPLTYNWELFNMEQMATVENYNTMFDAKFAFDREKLFKILNEKYVIDIHKESPNIQASPNIKRLLKSAKFEPDKYPAVNVKYVSRLQCQPNCISEGKKKNRKCGCKAISFLMFQDGYIIITGARAWNQILDGYQIISKILKDQYAEIRVDRKSQTGNLEVNLPTQITKFINGEKFIFLNKKQQIFNNPTNYFVLKKLDLLDKYMDKVETTDLISKTEFLVSETGDLSDQEFYDLDD